VTLGWLAGALLAHDAILAPVVVMVGLVLVRLLPGAVRRVVAAGLFAGTCLILVAIPVLGKPGVRTTRQRPRATTRWACCSRSGPWPCSPWGSP
jgi:hypothetical protein